MAATEAQGPDTLGEKRFWLNLTVSMFDVFLDFIVEYVMNLLFLFAQRTLH